MQDSYELLALRVKEYFDVEIHPYSKARHTPTCGMCFLPPQHPVHLPCPVPDQNNEEQTEGEKNKLLKK